MLEFLEKIGSKRPIYIINRSSKQLSNYKTSNKNEAIDKYKRSIVIFDDTLEAQKSSQIDEYFRRRRHESRDVYYISQSYFDLRRQSNRNNSDIISLLKQTLTDVESMYKVIGSYDTKYDDFKEMCRKAWSEKFIYLCKDMTKKENDGKYSVFNESKNTYIGNVAQSEAFYFSNFCFQLKNEMI